LFTTKKRINMTQKFLKKAICLVQQCVSFILTCLHKCCFCKLVEQKVKKEDDIFADMVKFTPKL